MENGNGRRPELWRPRYNYAEADYLAKVSKGTSKRWIEGYTYKRDGNTISIPPVTPHEAHLGLLSFIDLVEIAAIGRLKEHGHSLHSVRSIVLRCQVLFGIERPLPTLRFKVDARDAFVEDGDLLVAVGGRDAGKRAWDRVLAPFLSELDYEQVTGLAERWWPLGKSHMVVVDPEYGFGLPVVTGSGVRIEIIAERVRAGDLPKEIADDFNLTDEEVGAALQFELQRAA
jgi:uncharacterized protein (DUF433 family)